jgi:hypothetical protein
MHSHSTRWFAKRLNVLKATSMVTDDIALARRYKRTLSDFHLRWSPSVGSASIG